MKKFKSSFLVTGAAGFIGSEIVKRLLKNGEEVIGIDNLNNYYDPFLKKKRLIEIEKYCEKFKGTWHFYKVSIDDKDHLKMLFDKHTPKVVINLAAQAGVRYSIKNPKAYFDSNMIGFFNILELCREIKVENFIFASSSSVYGGNNNIPFKESNNTDFPLSFYGATKKANEALAHSYSHIFNIPTTGLRFFTVFGPWGRPDMAPMKFSSAIMRGEEIDIYNYGEMIRDFTYIDDVIEIIFRCSYKPANHEFNFNQTDNDVRLSSAPFLIFNVGNSKAISLLNFVELLEKNLGKKAKKNFVEMQIGDVKNTLSDSSKIKNWINFSPNTDISIGIKKFTNWYLDFYGS